MESRSHSAHGPSVPSLRTERKFSLKEAQASNNLLTALEEGHIDDVRRLVFLLPEGVTSALNTPSLLVKHKLRTPMMAAARTGDFAKFTAILNAFDRQYSNKLVRDFEMRLQLANRDRDGMTAAMLAARSGSVPIVAALITEIEQTEALLSLEARDHRHMTLLLHAASVGPAPVFHEVQLAILSSVQDEEEFGRQLLLKSADDKTILMHAASSGDAMLLKAVADACRTAIPPHQVREMLVNRDSDGLNFLMHAASCQTVVAASPDPVEVGVEKEDDNTNKETTGGDDEAGEAEQETDEMPPNDINFSIHHIVQDSGTLIAAAAADTSMPVTAPPGHSPTPDGLATPTTTTTTTTSNITAAAAGTSAAGAASSGVAAAGAEPLSKSAGAAAVAQAKGQGQTPAMERPRVVAVFKIAIKILTECLWKDKVLKELKATDLWGRNVLTHALLSGHKLMFEAALGAVRDIVTDEEVSEMLETNEGEREDEPMINALDSGETDLRKLFALRVGQLKSDVDARSKLSSIDAKIESFIPGKLVVIFQLLLPQIAVRNQLTLLYILCAIAPILKLATSAASKPGASSKRAVITARTGKLSIFLGAPAMFFWGVGTSDVGTTSILGWSPALSATTMAVATICIPAIDGFFYSSSAARWGDKISCLEWRFNFKACRRWLCVREESTAQIHHDANRRGYEPLPAYSNHDSTSASGLGGVEEGKHEPAATIRGVA